MRSVEERLASTLGLACLSGTRDRVIVGAFVLPFLIPFLALVTSAPPTKFGFQMYSGVGTLSAEFVDGAGVVHDVDFGPALVTRRADIDWIQRLPTHLCKTTPEAVEIRVRQDTIGDDRVVSRECLR